VVHTNKSVTKQCDSITKQLTVVWIRGREDEVWGPIMVHQPTDFPGDAWKWHVRA